MTLQISETIDIDGETFPIAEAPLGDYFLQSGKGSPFVSVMTACWRGYTGAWEIRDDRLYLLDLRGNLASGGRGFLVTLFPRYPDRVFAHWYTGTLTVQIGEPLPTGGIYHLVYAQEVLLDLDRGVVTGMRIRTNTVPEPPVRTPPRGWRRWLGLSGRAERRGGEA